MLITLKRQKIKNKIKINLNFTDLRSVLGKDTNKSVGVWLQTPMNKPRSQVLCPVRHLLERGGGKGGGGEYELKFTTGVNVFPQMLIDADPFTCRYFSHWYGLPGFL